MMNEIQIGEVHLHGNDLYFHSHREGGPAPYVLSGMPEGIPSIYEFTAPASGFTLPALIKAHAH